MATPKNPNLEKLTSEELQILKEWLSYCRSWKAHKVASPIRIGDGHPWNWEWDPSIMLFTKLISRSSK